MKHKYKIIIEEVQSVSDETLEEYGMSSIEEYLKNIKENFDEGAYTLEESFYFNDTFTVRVELIEPTDS